LRDTLRAIWRAPDERTKEWGLFRISQHFFLQGDPSLIKLPTANASDFMLCWKPPSRTERFLLELMRWADLLRFCCNPDCDAPYFIANKRSQKYCHTECSRPAQRKSKRKWWATTGRQRRSAKRKRWLCTVRRCGSRGRNHSSRVSKNKNTRKAADLDRVDHLLKKQIWPDSSQRRHSLFTMTWNSDFRLRPLLTKSNQPLYVCFCV